MSVKKQNNRGRSGGQFRQKRSDARIGNLEKKYGVDFNVRSDTKLGTYLKKEGVPSLSKALKKIGK